MHYLFQKYYRYYNYTTAYLPVFIRINIKNLWEKNSVKGILNKTIFASYWPRKEHCM